MKLYKKIANATRWIALTDEFKTKKMIELDELSNLLPSGSGIDSGCTIDEEKSTENKIVIRSSFHHMDENGYCGWSEFTVTVIPDFMNDFNLKIVGNNAIYPAFSYIKDYLYELFRESLNENIVKSVSYDTEGENHD